MDDRHFRDWYEKVVIQRQIDECGRILTRKCPLIQYNLSDELKKQYQEYKESPEGSRSWRRFQRENEEELFRSERKCLQAQFKSELKQRNREREQRRLEREKHKS